MFLLCGFLAMAYVNLAAVKGGGCLWGCVSKWVAISWQWPFKAVLLAIKPPRAIAAARRFI
jgi:hypothetical protein